MKLAHHTTTCALGYIDKEKRLLPMFDCIWMTSCLEGEMTAGLFMPEEHRARIVIESFGKELYKVDDIQEEFPHLNFHLLNQISDTSKWYVSFEPIDESEFVSVSTMSNGQWVERGNLESIASEEEA